VILQSADASEFIASFAGARPDWVVLDSYSLDSEWETAVRPFVEKIAVIEDLADRRHDCDLLIDQNYTDRSTEIFKRQVPDACELLLGPHFALISKEFRMIREIKTRPANELKRILVFCGGSDPQNLTQQVIDELSCGELSSITVDVVIGAQNKSFDRDASRKLKSNFVVHDAGSEFAQIMRRADLAIGAGGTTTWERMCLGVPSILVSIAENQNHACKKLGRDGLITHLGEQASLEPGVIRAAVIGAKTMYASLFNQIKRQQILVDGRGCERVVDKLMLLIS